MTTELQSPMFFDLQRRMCNAKSGYNVAKNEDAVYYYRWTVMRGNAVATFAFRKDQIISGFCPAIDNRVNGKLLMISSQKCATKEDALYEAHLWLLAAQMGVNN